CSGVTAVFDVGGYPWTLDLPRRFGDSTEVPHVAAAAPLLSTLDHWLNLPAERQFIFLTDADVGRSGVRYLASQGSHAVKVWFIPNKDRTIEQMAVAVRAAGEEAKRLRLTLIVHSTGLEEAKAALKAGAHLLVHSVWDKPIDQEFLDLLKAKGTIYCPTLTVARGYVRMFAAAVQGKAPAVDDPNGCLDPVTLAKVAATATAGAGGVTAEQLATRDRVTGERERTAAANLKRVKDAGVTIAMGTDAGNPLTLHGPSVYAEMEAMQAAGLSPMEVLVASTRGGAIALGMDKEIGTVEKGKVADLLVVGADPAADVKNLRQVRYVVRGGVLRSLAELKALATTKEK